MRFLSFADCWYWFLIAAIACYLVGCLNFAVIIGKFKKTDIRHTGSGNPGTMNMTRSLGLKFGALNFFLDVAKGGVPALVGYFIFKDCYFAGTMVIVSDFARYFFGAFVIIGHIFPFYMKFKGGKGIASTMGLFVFALPCEQWWFIFIVVLFLASVLFYIAVTEWGSMGSLLGVSGLTIWQGVIFAVRYSQEIVEFNPFVITIFMLLLLLNLLTWLRHSENITRLLAGEEHHTAVKKHKK